MARRPAPRVAAAPGLAALLSSPRVGGACHYAGQRDHCTGTACVLRGTVPLCSECAARASSLTRLPVRALPPAAPPPPPLPAATPWPRRRPRSPTEELEALARVRTGLPRREVAAVRAARSSGLSWAEVGAALGMTQQAAHKRFRRYAP